MWRFVTGITAITHLSELLATLEQTGPMGIGLLEVGVVVNAPLRSQHRDDFATDAQFTIENHDAATGR